MSLENLSVILTNPRFPENIGMVARACANMGCENLILVKPENWNFEKAVKTATSKGSHILENACVSESLAEALQFQQSSWAATARTGGWRREIEHPEQAANEIALRLLSGENVALVFGNEKSGLANSDIILCSHIVTIPAFGGLSSLNLAQASLIMLYECAKMVKILQDRKCKSFTRASRRINSQQIFLLEEKLKKALIMLQCCQGKNPDYYFISWHNMLAKMNLDSHDFAMLMGLCRQIFRLSAKLENAQKLDCGHALSDLNNLSRTGESNSGV